MKRIFMFVFLLSMVSFITLWSWVEVQWKDPNEREDNDVLPFSLRVRKSKDYEKIDYPDFFIIGTWKSGTTSLLRYLDSHHPHICMASHELNYYSRNPPNPWKWLGWIDVLYKRNFQTCLEKRKPSSTSSSSSPTLIIGEKSASYLYHRETPLRISQHLSNGPKFIVLLRNPISRLHSHWFMNICKGRIESTFKQWFWKDEINKKVGFYAQQLKKWLEVYPNPNSTYLPSSSLLGYAPLNSSPVGGKLGFLKHPQFLILRSEDFFTKTVESLKKIDEFLGVHKLNQDWNWERNRQLVEGVVYGSSPRCVEKMGQNRQEIEPEFRRQLEKFYYQANQELTELLGAEFNFNLENREYSPEIESQDRNENDFLDDYYNDDTEGREGEEDDDEG